MSYTPADLGILVDLESNSARASTTNNLHRFVVESALPLEQGMDLVLPERPRVHDQVGDVAARPREPRAPDLELRVEACQRALHLRRALARKIFLRSFSTSPRIGSRPPTVSSNTPIRWAEDVEHTLLDGAGDEKIEDRSPVLLADAVDPADALLDLHRVPRQVVVDQDVAELEVSALAAGLGRDEDLRPWPSRNRVTAASFSSGLSRPWKRLTVHGLPMFAAGSPACRGTG